MYAMRREWAMCPPDVNCKVGVYYLHLKCKMSCHSYLHFHLTILILPVLFHWKSSSFPLMGFMAHLEACDGKLAAKFRSALRTVT